MHMQWTQKCSLQAQSQPELQQVPSSNASLLQASEGVKKVDEVHLGACWIDTDLKSVGEFLRLSRPQLQSDKGKDRCTRLCSNTSR